MNAFDSEAFDTGERIYTDDRFPDIFVVNGGGPHFEVYQRQPSGAEQPIDDFKGYETPGHDQVSEAFARRRARSYFDQLANTLIPEVFDDEEEEKPEHPSQAEVDALIAAARREPDPVKAAQLKKQALQKMSLESVADLLVAHCLNG